MAKSVVKQIMKMLPPGETDLSLTRKAFKVPEVLAALSKAQIAAGKVARCVMNDSGRTAIELRREKDGTVVYIPMASEGLVVCRATADRFKDLYPYQDPSEPGAPSCMKNSRIDRAAKTYVQHATFAGCSDDALIELEALVPITTRERDEIMSTKKTKKAEAPRVAGAVGNVKNPAKGKKATGEAKQRSGAAATFREMIMAGKLTDDQIFVEVRKRHPDVTEDKRHYVAWYRNQLKKQGKKPPAAKQD